MRGECTSTTRPPDWTPPDPIPARFEALGLVIRRYTLADADELRRVVEASRASLLPWLPWAMRTHRTIDETRAEIIRFDAGFASLLASEESRAFGLVFGVYDAHRGDLLGGTGFNRLDPATHNAETGYWVRVDRRREGIATRILRAVLSLGFLPQDRGGMGFRRIHLFAGDRNLASCGVPRKIGLHEHHHAHDDRWVDGIGWCGTVGWNVLAREWDPREHRLRAC